MKKTDLKETARGIGARLGRFRFPLLILLLGLVILAIPARPEEKGDEAPAPAVPDGGIAEVEARMEEILSRIEGAGRVRVMLQYAAGEKCIFQTDSEQEVRAAGGEQETRTRIQTVLSSREQGKDTPVVVQTVCPIFRGAVVVAEGADVSAVKLNLVNAVSSLTGLGADKITVLKGSAEQDAVSG